MMGVGFQQIIDAALVGVNRHRAQKSVHFAPVGEEKHRAEILSFLDKREMAEPLNGAPRVHVGVAGGFNFSIIAKTLPDRILLLDMNERQEKFWYLFIDLLSTSDSPEAFINAFKKTRGRFLTFGTEAEYLQTADWMNPDTYAYLHRLAQEGNIAAATLDIVNDGKAAIAIGNAIKQNSMRVDTCYWSNIASWFKPLGSAKPSTRGTVFQKPFWRPLRYPTYAFYQETIDNSGLTPRSTIRWNGKDTGRADVLPMFERMLRNISAIGYNLHTNHILADADDIPSPPVITDGPPRHLKRIANRKDKQEGRNTDMERD